MECHIGGTHLGLDFRFVVCVFLDGFGVFDDDLDGVGRYQRRSLLDGALLQLLHISFFLALISGS
jgi:hypothetical protein